ncbi:hypothetical protein EST38_g1353 [Candolleomyces aberdarensis]|uniref:Zn(2)-C6 fungal-type domain-containing protein n=1 Tax=Candolleomyces aberdarensis TaxID=2316362 RepID=A0A4Q2DW36_9AGAR|nr:hypothetical protein EST38_g1353 [Candolleomyces aberdarensis]
MPYRSSEYYIPPMPNHNPHVQNISSAATPRTFAPEPHRGELYSDPHFYGSYDRHHGGHPPELHLPSVPTYRSQFADRPSPLPPLKRPDISNMGENFSLPPPHSSYLPETDSSLSAQPARLIESDLWGSGSTTTSSSPQAQPAPSYSPSEPPKPKKTRREKPKIALAPDQPPTTQGKPRARVYVACIQCRTRKIRCDGAKPACHNCGRRTTGNNECTYDPVPKRRGPDKTPGARQRMARDAQDEADGARRRRRRDTSATDMTSASTSSTRSASTPRPEIPQQPITLALPPGSSEHSPYNSPTADFAPVSNYVRSSYSPESGGHGIAQCPDLLDARALPGFRKTSGAIPTPTYHDAFDLSSLVPPFDSTTSSYIAELDEQGNEHQSDNTLDIGSQPSLSFTRKVWWDSLLSLYHSSNTSHLQPLTSGFRENIARRIAHDLRWVFRASNYWFSFFHIPSFFANFHDPLRRERMQPSLILSLLAISTFFQSSEIGLGRYGRERALRFRDEAQGALEASFNSGWIDETLAQAAWVRPQSLSAPFDH